jgi:hypothetical protein
MLIRIIPMFFGVKDIKSHYPNYFGLFSVGTDSYGVFGYGAYGSKNITEHHPPDRYADRSHWFELADRSLG